MFRWTFLCSSFCPLLSITKKNLAPSIRYLYILMWSSVSLLQTEWGLSQLGRSNPHLCCPQMDRLQELHASLTLRSPELDMFNWTAPLCPPLQAVEVILKSCTALSLTSFQLCVVSELRGICLLIQATDEQFKQYWTSTEPLGTPLETGLQWDPVRLITVLGDLRFKLRKFELDEWSVRLHLTVHSSSPYFLSLPMRTIPETMSKSLLKVQVNIHCFSLSSTQVAVSA